MSLETIICCVLIADFLTGFFHWLEDTYGVPTWWLIGKPVILPNIDHHRRPTAFTMGSFISRNIQPFLGVVFILAMCAIFGYLSWAIVLVAGLAGLGNEVHTWTHRKQNNNLVSFLQETGLVISKSQHAKHHKPPYDKYFCTLTNIVNPCLELVRFWKMVEYLLMKIGIQPKRMTLERDGY